MTLERRKPLSAKPRGKGNAGELEVIKILWAAGWPRARRNFMSGGQGGGDLLEGPRDVHLEIKRRERCAIKEWIRQAWSEARPTDIPMVVFRRNRTRWYAALPWTDWTGLLDDLPVAVFELAREGGRLSLWDWLAEAEANREPAQMPVVAFRCDGMRYAGVEFDKVLELLAKREGVVEGLTGWSQSDASPL